MAKIITIGELVSALKSFDPNDTVNFGSNIGQYLEARTYDHHTYTLHTRSSHDSWQSVELTGSPSKVGEVLSTLEKFLPEHKDKCVATIRHCAYRYVTNKAIPARTHNFEFNENITDLPQIKLQNAEKTWKKFEDEITKFSKCGGTNTLPAAQFYLMQHPELGQIYCVSDKFYHTYEDVRANYPELTDSKDDQGLFEDNLGVRVCGLGRSELEQLCQRRANPKYVTSNGTFSREELLEKYNITESQIDKLFVPTLDGMICKIPELLFQLQK